MPKRKHGDALGEGREVRLDRMIAVRRKHAEEKIVHGIKLLNKALKTARGFERQKLGRRQKTAKSQKNEADLARLDAEIEALKSLDFIKVAQNHLYKVLLKTKTIASSPSFPPDIEAKLKVIQAPLSPAIANVTARLYASNPVKTTMGDVTASIRYVLGVGEHAPKQNQTESQTDASPGEDGESDAEEKQPKMAKKEAPTKIAESDSPGFEGSGSGESEDERGPVPDVEDEEDEEDYSRYNARLASSSDEGSEDEDEDGIAEIRGWSKAERARNARHSASPTPSDDRSSSPPPNKSKKQKTEAAPPKSTTFLPSLMMGGYLSGSESEPEDDIPENQPRKNRRGQQARRALWEKKFGSGAKHLQKAGRDADWDPRRGARGADDRDPKARFRGRGAKPGGYGQSKAKPDQMTGANNMPVGPRKAKNDDQGPLHPSWQAAKLAKEQKQASFQGKKVVFD
ncbi:Bud-site selection protein [Xylona heveae TC161]|uniref:Bud-site selection protein n=1 Tax=Xylona heveae (strain CBS 132557 / TC161) TaxID=1328760 RepID=A0A165FJ14_XYLHT|nr:Bud-site selection protein [Xylona heveae TC161]KZF21034.1 Bud-site selection protein [Xylona heveae TC161]